MSTSILDHPIPTTLTAKSPKSTSSGTKRKLSILDNSKAVPATKKISLSAKCPFKIFSDPIPPPTPNSNSNSNSKPKPKPKPMSNIKHKVKRKQKRVVLGDLPLSQYPGFYSKACINSHEVSVAALERLWIPHSKTNELIEETSKLQIDSSGGSNTQANDLGVVFSLQSSSIFSVNF